MPVLPARPRAVVLGVEHPRALAVLRSLGRAGVPIVGVDDDPTARGLHSRYLTERALVDPAEASVLRCLASLAGGGGGVLIPTNDRYLAIVARHHASLAERFTLTTPPWDLLRRLFHKPACYAIAREAGLRTPTWHAPADRAALERVVAGLDVERRAHIVAVAEPASLVPADVRTGRMTKAAGRTTAALRDDCLDVLARTGRPPVILEVVPGEARTSVGVSMVVDPEQSVHACHAVRRLQLYLYRRDRVYTHPYELGANVYCESVHDDEAVDAAHRFVRHARYYGPITLEFRRDASDGGLVLVKADPRVVRATALSTALGLDVPATLYTIFTGGQAPPARPYRDGIAWVWLTWYLSTLWRNRDESPVGRELARFVRALPRVKAWAYLDVRDPLPFAVDVWRWARIGVRWGRRGGRCAL
jgi:D-aspartate ligase